MPSAIYPKLLSGWCDECWAYKSDIYGLCSCGKFTTGYIVQAVCSCGTRHGMTEGEVEYLERRELSLPKRCPKCRAERKQKLFEERVAAQVRADAREKLVAIEKALAAKRAEIQEINNRLAVNAKS